MGKKDDDSGHFLTLREHPEDRSSGMLYLIGTQVASCNRSAKEGGGSLAASEPPLKKFDTGEMSP